METPRRQNSIKSRWVTGISIALLGCLGFVSMALSDTGTPPGQKSKAFPSYSGFEGIDPTRNHFLVVSDTQKTSRLEFWRERNDRERRLIIDEMTRREPAFILHLGDLTARGSSKKHWDEFDDLNKALREKSIPCFPVLGNHELYGNDKVGLEYYFSRFPHLMNRRWYSFTWKNVGLILLDSNFSDLTPEQMDLQEKWYWGELERFNHDEKLDHIIVCCHHPPFTNSQVVAPSEKSKRYFADPFMRFQKTRIFFSGHGHTYERFQAKDKIFIVGGGGGGPRHKVYIDPQKRRFDDLFPGPGLRFFHFCEIALWGKGLNYRVQRLEPDGTFTVTDPLTIPFP